MTLSKYHQTYASKSDEEIEKRAQVKEEELRKIFTKVTFKPSGETIRIAVLGCGERRLIKHHQRIFEKLFKRPIELITFDLNTDHLGDEVGVVQHDVTKPLPGGPYDLTYAHVLLKFIEREKQWAVIKNSYDALRSPGMAIHIFDSQEIEEKGEKLPDGYYSVPLEVWKEKLGLEGIEFQELSWSIKGVVEIPIEGLSLVLLK